MSTTTGNKPLILFQPDGQPSILSYNIAEPTSYNGRNFIDLNLDRSYFIQNSTSSLTNRALLSDSMATFSNASFNNLDRSYITESMSKGFLDKRLFLSNNKFDGSIRLVQNSDSNFQIKSSHPISPKLANLHPDGVIGALNEGKKLAIYQSMYGSLTYDFINTFTSNGHENDLSYLSKASNISPQHMLPDGPPPPPDKSFFSIKITSPANGATITGPANNIPINITGTCSDVDHIIQKVELTISPNPSKQAIQTKQGDWSNWSVSDTITNEGPHTITAKATDVDGNVKTSIINITTSFIASPDKTPPTVSIISPKFDETVSGPNGNVTIKVSGTASDNPGGSGLGQVEVKIGNNAFKLATPSAPGDWSNWSASDIVTSEGSQTIIARAHDKAGNTSNDVSVNIKSAFIVTPPTSLGRPRIFIIESYLLSSYLGNYGAGRTIKTLTLLPGEKTKLTFKTFHSEETQSKQASTILDSFTEESAADFESTLNHEQSDKQNYSQSLQYEINAKAHASWGWGGIDISGGVKSAANSTREEFVKNISNVTQKHTSKASAKRDINISTEYESKIQSTEETVTEQEIQNINVSRTLNFIFRQINQEFITFLHLVDIRIGYFFDVNPADQTTWIQKEVPLSDLDSLLTLFIVPGRAQEVKNAILNQLSPIINYKGDAINDFITSVSLSSTPNGPAVRTYFRVNKDYTATYVDPSTNTTRIVPGIIMSANKYVLRTDGVVVESLLGAGDALDSYSHGLQNESVKDKTYHNTLLSLEILKNQLGIDIVKAKDAQSAQLYAQVFPPNSSSKENGQKSNGSVK
jgi:hypothetical protein